MNTQDTHTADEDGPLPHITNTRLMPIPARQKETILHRPKHIATPSSFPFHFPKSRYQKGGFKT